MTDSEDHRRTATVVGEMPPFWKIAEALWGSGVDFDSDGDSADRNATDWRELSIALRPGSVHRLDIDPIAGDRDTIVLRATSPALLARAIAFLEVSGSIRIVNR